MIISRRALLLGATAPLIRNAAQARQLRRAGGTSGNSPDGAFIAGLGSPIVLLTGAVPSLQLTWGTFTLGAYRSDVIPHWGYGDFYELFLNGHRIAPFVQKALVWPGAASGNFFYTEEDEIVWQWSNFQVSVNDGGPPPEPPNPAPPFQEGPLPDQYLGPYTPSADGTTISGGTGTLTTRDGVYSWGSASGGGYVVQLQGIPVLFNSPHLIALQMQVNSNGQLFYQTTDTVWHAFLGYQQRSANTPTGQAIPLHVDKQPFGVNNDLVYYVSQNSTPVGTVVGTMSVTMSDGSAFSGTIDPGLNSGALQLYDAVNNGDGTITVKTRNSPFTNTFGNVQNTNFVVTQNGTSVSTITTAEVGA